MIVKIGVSGTSFAGLAKYLTHDPEVETTERVAFTHTENLANNFVPSAVDEMIWTYRDAELIKQETGVRAGGRSSQHPVKHLSLNWHPDDHPSQDHMIETGQNFLKSMGWHEHQAIFVAHNDKAYEHLHIVVNEVHPETGLKLDDGFERRRAQKWAANYEREMGIIRCEQRELAPEDREPNMPRNIWKQFQKNEKEFQEKDTQFLGAKENSEGSGDNRWKFEWDVFKQFQKDERLEFYADGRKQFKDLRNGIYREVRGEFRERWAGWFQAESTAKPEEKDKLAETKKALIEEQNKVLEERRKPAFKDLMKEREQKKLELSSQQNAQRAEFRARLQTGQDNADFFNGLAAAQPRRSNIKREFDQAAHEVTSRTPADTGYTTRREDHEHAEQAHHTIKKPHSLESAAKAKAVAVVSSVADGLFSILTLGGVHENRGAEPIERSDYEVAAEEATKRAVQEARDANDEKWREKQRESWRRWDREYYRE